MGWNYVAKSGSKENRMIYDNALTDDQKTIPAYTATVTDAKSKPNYTLVWDNWNVDSKGHQQNIVYVALEFVNNGAPFWGETNLIPTGGTFYISGKLDPDADLSTADRSAGITWPTDYALPPYKADGTSVNKRRIFIQDYKTIANFTIPTGYAKTDTTAGHFDPTTGNTVGLGKAYNTIPDLRSPKLELGLSVDLTWQQGITFNNVEF